jgi:hypothetical protein
MMGQDADIQKLVAGKKINLIDLENKIYSITLKAFKD